MSLSKHFAVLAVSSDKLGKEPRISCVMAQAVSRRPLTAEAWIRTQVRSGTGFSPSYSLFICHYHSTVSVYSYHL
jgi:hypothetical protein